MDRSSTTMMKDETVERIQDLEAENDVLQSLVYDLRWRASDICMLGIACFCMGFLSHGGLIAVYKWLCSWVGGQP